MSRKEWEAIIAEIDRDGLSFVEVADRLDCTRETVSRWYYRIKKRSRTKRFNSRPDLNPPPNKQSVVLVIPDLHCPFHHPDALDFLRAVKRRFLPSKFVCLGDEIDAHAMSKYPQDPDGLTAGKELESAIECLIPFYVEFPDMLVCESNHTVRPWKRAFEAGLPAAFLPTVSKVLKAPDGWTWASRHEVDGVLYIHGDNGKSGQYAHINYAKQRKGSVVIGHVHSYAGVNYEGDYFAMNTGCLIDPAAYCFKYAKNMLNGVNLGCGLVFNGQTAHFIPMLLDESGRWTGRL